MTTTYELYTNENGTPKAVEGKAPAILERVEALETDVETLDGDIKTLDEDVGNIQTAIEVLEGGVVKTINGETPDQTGNIDIPVGHNVGEEWVSYTGKIPNGGVPYCGQIVTRATYADLWAYAQAQGLVKTESEWQSWSSSHGGNVPYYSSGNGSTTFRMPSIKGYVKGASSQAEAGEYIAEGLPNIEGELHPLTVGLLSGDTEIVTGAFKNTSTVMAGGYSGSQLKRLDNLTFDASRSNPIYGDSDHVTPETNTVLFGVFAFGGITNIGELDATTLATGLATVEANLEAKLDKTTAHIVETWKRGTSWYRKYSDGWIEQGGYASASRYDTTKKVSLNKAFSNTNYTIVATTVNKRAVVYSDGTSMIAEKTTTSFVLTQMGYEDNIVYANWYACGY